MDVRFLEALIHRDHKILGYSLQPYCLAHSVTLEAIGSPLASGDGLADAVDIIAFLKVCSAPNPFRPNFKATLMDKFHAARLRSDKHREKVLDKINSYFEDFASMPTLAEKRETGDGFVEPTRAAASAPWVVSRVASLHLNTNLTDEEIYRKPLGYLMWLDAAICEHKGGDVKFYDPANPDLNADEIAELRELAKEPMPAEIDEPALPPGWGVITPPVTPRKRGRKS